jgi:hypothetical protein
VIDSRLDPGGVEVAYKIYTLDKGNWISVGCPMAFTSNRSGDRAGLLQKEKRGDLPKDNVLY